ncbi:hypothetical protein [Streptomyces alkaliphilus]|uniref:hypothetical protein n=1 Tax=Streptomyces alkaliphilus TaxID=1472722 RepID=UPI0011816E22|nr:hypothetical protein [Streptomyces alkaliphilus]MQS06113.1 hypothetical protein [Streptomyces alkaliphilus]
MEAILLLIALTAIFGVLGAPAIRRHQERKRLERAAENARHGDPAGGFGPRPGAGPGAGGPGERREGISLEKEGDGPAGVRHPGGPVPVEQLDVRLPGPDDALVTALEETTNTQDWRPVGRLLALTEEYELRWQRVQSVAGAAAMELARWRAEHGTTAGAPDNGPAPGAAGDVPGAGAPAGADGVRRDAGWLRNWRAEEPRDPGGAQVYAQFLVWQAMSDTGSADHRIILEEARTVCAEASRLAPDDPTPFITELFVARGLDYRRPDFEAVWAEITRRRPDHMGAHLTALTHWSEKWHGSRDEAYGFAQSSAAAAPGGSLLPALPLFAVYEHLPEMSLSPSVFTGKVVSDAVEAARFALHHAEPGHPVEPHVRHLLLWFLVRAERFGEAAEHVWAVDGYVGAVPWVNSPDPAREYAGFRALAIGLQ